jgi:RHS repeat-associated protein
MIATYAYDGHSMRVVKVWGGGRTFDLYDGSQLTSEFEDAASNTYSSGTTPGAAVADSSAIVLYQHADQLTTRVTTDNTGTVASVEGHYPFGDGWYVGGTADPSVERKFTSYLKDDEASNAELHYAQAREDSVRFARFQTTDPVLSHVKNPQRLNRYSYVGGDPINHRDASGRDFGNYYEIMDGGSSPGVDGGGWSCDGFVGESGCGGLGGCGGWDALGLEDCGPGDGGGGGGGGGDPCGGGTQFTTGDPGEQPGCQPPPPPPPPAPVIEGFAQLKYRPITWLEKLHDLAPNHAFWYVDAFGGDPFILDAGPSTKWVTLVFWATPGLFGHYREDNVGATTWFATPVSRSNSGPVFAMISFTKLTGNTHLPYDVFIWDSNTAAHLIGLAGGFNPSRPPGALGW